MLLDRRLESAPVPLIWKEILNGLRENFPPSICLPFKLPQLVAVISDLITLSNELNRVTSCLASLTRNVSSAPSLWPPSHSIDHRYLPSSVLLHSYNHFLEPPTSRRSQAVGRLSLSSLPHLSYWPPLFCFLEHFWPLHNSMTPFFLAILFFCLAGKQASKQERTPRQSILISNATASVKPSLMGSSALLQHGACCSLLDFSCTLPH